MLRIIRCFSLNFGSIYRGLWNILLFLLWFLVLWLSNLCLFLNSWLLYFLWSVLHRGLTLLIYSTLFQFFFFFKPFQFLLFLFLFFDLFLLLPSLFSLLFFKELLQLEFLSFFFCLFSLKLSSESLFSLPTECFQLDLSAKSLYCFLLGIII